MTRPPDPGTFEKLLTIVTVPLGDVVRLSGSPTTEPYWAKRAKSRFDAPARVPKASRYGVLYAAPSVETAFCESTIHENSLFNNGAFEVALSELDRREITWYAHPTKTELRLVDLTGAALKKLGLNADISAGGQYKMSKDWSLAIHEATTRRRVDGIRYSSRQHTGEYCYAIFERSGLTMRDHRPFTAMEKVTLCKKFNVKPV